MSMVKLGDIPVRVVRKNVKHIRLHIVPPTHEVRISIPAFMPIETAQALAMSKVGWLRQRLAILRAQDLAAAQQPEQAPTCFLWGRRYALEVVEYSGSPRVELREGAVRIFINAPTLAQKREELLDRWYRQELMDALFPLRKTWEARMGVTIGRIVLQRMKTRWGTSNSATRTIRINTELAKKPRACLEYLLVHEMTHLFYNNHGTDFQSAMDHWLPNWRMRQCELDTSPRS